MSKAYVGKIGNINKTKAVEEVLNFPDYVFEIIRKTYSYAENCIRDKSYRVEKIILLIN